MSFDSDDYDDRGSSEALLPDIDKIDRVESASERSNKNAIIRIDYDLCENSGVCAQVCPEDVIEPRNGESLVVRPSRCTECWICVENCTSGALEIA